MAAHSIDSLAQSPTQPYHIRFFEEELAPLNLKRSRVLEIGCGFGHVLRLLAAHEPRIERLVGISDQHYGQPPQPRYEVLWADARALPFDDASFDLVYSLATFEHVRELPQALAELRRVLQPCGCVIAVFSPIWSGFNGHHYGSTLSDPGDHDVDLPWAHLVFDPPELERHLIESEGFLPQEAARAVHSIHHDPWLNRLHLSDYRSIIAGSGFIIERFEEHRADRNDMRHRIDRFSGRDPETFVAIQSFLQSAAESDSLTYKLKLTLAKP